MVLVDYSGSDTPDEEEKPANKQSTKQPATNKPAFQKVVDRSDPHKIRVSLPEVSKSVPDGKDSERPSKRAKIGSGGMSGFNALLPAPKRAAAPNGGVSLGGSRKGGLGSGVNLRIGAAPGFSREPEPNISSVEEGYTESSDAATAFRAPEAVAVGATGADAALSKECLVEEPKSKSKSTIFKPLSVARKPQKKKAPPTGPGGTTTDNTNDTQPKEPAPKVSLFSTSDVSETSREEAVGKGAYQPIVYHTNTIDPTPSFLEAPNELEAESGVVATPNLSTNDSPPQSLDTIASDLNLSKSSKRQLLGRHRNNASAVNIVNFNTDEEYQANEDIRKSGEQVQHNAVRAIAPGKHSLKQLVNMGTAQAEALEESFASGRRNRSEAGSNWALSFPLDPLYYDTAREAWEGKKNLIFVGQDPSCFAPHEQRSSFKSLSIAFDDALHTVKVTGKPLEFGDKHFPAPTHLVIGRPPSDVTLTRRQILEKRDEQGIGHCIRHPRKCLNEKLKEEIDKGLTFPFKSPPKQINFSSKATEAKKKYWPPDEYNRTGIPPIVEVYCLNCEFAGAMEQVFTMEFHPVDGSKVDVDDSNDDEDDNDDDDDANQDADDDRFGRPDDDDNDDEDDHGQMFKDHVKRTFVTYTATDEIKFRKQIQIKTGGGVDAYCSIPIPGRFVPPSSMGCGTYFTGGGLSWEPGAAQVDKASRATAEGPTKVGDGKAGKSISGMGYSLWPLDIGVYLWMDFGISTKADVTLPGFEATIAKGSVMEVDITGDRKGITKKFEPVIEMLEPDLSIHDTEMHYNIAIGPKVGFSLGLPMGKVALGFGAGFDILRIDNRLAEYNNVTSVCAQPKEKEEVFKRALGYTMDVKTGFYAYFNLAGFYIDSSWLGDKTGDGIGGLYWGVKNLIAKCVDCGQDSCLKKAVAEVLGVVKEGFASLLGEGFEDVDGRKKAAVTRLKDSAHVRKESIDSLDSQIQGMDMPSGDPNISCYATSASSRQQYERRQWESTSPSFLGQFVDHKKPNLCKQTRSHYQSAETLRGRHQVLLRLDGPGTNLTNPAPENAKADDTSGSKPFWASQATSTKAAPRAVKPVETDTRGVSTKADTPEATSGNVNLPASSLVSCNKLNVSSKSPVAPSQNGGLGRNG